jgi:uncharacterized protein
MILAMAQAWLVGAAIGMAAPSAEWSPDVFDYDHPARLEVQDAPDPGKLRVPGAALKYLTFKDTRGEDVPVLIATPKGSGPFPTAVLVHGYTSSKDQVTSMVAGRLLERGFATIALDLPMHGARTGPPEELFTEPDARKTYARLVQAVVDIRQVIDLAESRKELDTSKGVYLVGYSMGGWLAALAGGAERRVAAMVLMVPVSEAKPPTAKPEPKPKDEPKPLLDVYPALRPTGAIAHFAPRPVLIQAGELDGYLRKSAVDALIAAARQPKELRWYPCGHILNEKALAEAGAWLADRASGKKVEAKAGSEGKPAARPRPEGAKERKRDGAKRK